MRVLFTAFSLGKGLGGHTRSMKQIANELSSNIEVFTLILGQKNNFDLKRNEFHINFKKNNFFFVRNKLTKILKDNKIDLIHSFDDFSYILCQISIRKHRLITRCGGQNPKNFPHANFITCFSLENYNFFKKRKKYLNSNLYLIPNRVKLFESDFQLIEDLSKKINKKNNDLIILRIGTIGDKYILTINQSINLYKKIQDQNHDKNVKLLIIGSVYNNGLFRKLEYNHNSDKNIFFVTDSKYTLDAKKIIDIADIVIGTGRGFMEASSKGKILFAPVQDSYFPSYVNESNFDLFFQYNFSERTPTETNLNNKDILKTIYLNDNKFFSNSIFKKYFDIENILEKYKSVYQEVLNSEVAKRNFFVIAKYYIYCKLLLFKYKD